MMWYLRNSVVLIFIFVMMSWGNSFQWQAPPYQIYRFANGFSLVVIENHANPLVSTVVLVRAGLRNETPEINGISHMLEHMTFNGTRRRTQEALYNELDSLGIYLNAHTDYDYTNYLALSYSRYFPNSVEILADMLMHSTFPQEKFEKEKGIIVEEVGKDADRPDYQIDLAFQRFLYQGTPYEMPVIGTVSSIANMKRQAVVDYYHRYYQPGNMVAVVVGDIEPERARDIFERYFGTVKSQSVSQPNISLNRHYPVVHAQENGDGKYIYLAIPAPTLHNLNYLPFQIIYDYAFAEEGVVIQALKNNPRLDVQRVSVNYEVHPEFAHLTFKFRTGKHIQPAALRRAFVQELERLGLQGITESDVQLIQQNTAISDILDRDQIMYYGFFRSQQLALGGIDAFLKTVPGILQQTPKTVQKLLTNYHRFWTNPNALFQPVNWWQKMPLPQPPKGEQNGSRRFQQVVKDTLANGLLWVHFRNTDSPVLGIHVLFRNRAAWEDTSTMGITDLLHRLYFKGSAMSSARDFQKRLKAIGAEVKTHDNDYIPFDDYYNQPTFSYIRFKTIDPFATEAFSLLREGIGQPDFSSATVEQVKKQLLGVLQMKNRQASYQASLGFRRLLLGATHPLAFPVSGTSQTIAAITPEQLKQFHMRYVSGNNIILSVVSGLPTEVIRRLITQAFGDLPRADEIPQFPPLQATAGADTVIQEMGKQQAMIYWGYVFPADSLDWNAATVANSLFSSQLAFHLREEQGLAYRLGATVRPIGTMGQFYIRMGTRPQNLPRALAGILKEIQQFAQQPLLPGMIVRTKNAIIASMVRRTATRENQAYYLGYTLFSGQGISDYLNRVHKIERVTPERVHKVRDYFLQWQNYRLFIVK